MKVVLFLYPIKVFYEWTRGLLDFSFGPSGVLEESDLYALNEVLEVRYRARGYEVAWLMPAKRRNRHLPTMDRLSEFVTPEPQDLFLSKGAGGHRIFRDFVVEQLPLETIEEVVVGGFMWNQCTWVVARYLRSLGYNSSIDEDLTEVILRKIHIWRSIYGHEYPLSGAPFEPWHAFMTWQNQILTYKDLLIDPWVVRELNTDQLGFMNFDTEERMVVPRFVFEEMVQSGQL